MNVEEMKEHLLRLYIRSRPAHVIYIHPRTMLRLRAAARFGAHIKSRRQARIGRRRAMWSVIARVRFYPERNGRLANTYNKTPLTDIEKIERYNELVEKTAAFVKIRDRNKKKSVSLQALTDARIANTEVWETFIAQVWGEARDIAHGKNVPVSAETAEPVEAL